MKNPIKSAVLVASAIIALVVPLQADDKKKETIKPYTLDKCIVTDEKLGEHGKPYVFAHESQEVKLCCKSCLPDFKKEPAKYLKKIEDGSKKTK